MTLNLITLLGAEISVINLRREETLNPLSRERNQK